MAYPIRHPDDLRPFLAPRPGLSRRTPLQIQVHGFDSERQQHWQRRFDAYRRRCGCLAGSVVSLATLVAVLVVVTLHRADFSLLGWIATLPIIVVATAAAGFIAKLAVLRLTRYQFHRACLCLFHELQHTDKGSTDVHVH